MFTSTFRNLPRLHLLEVTTTLRLSLVLGIYHEAQRGSPKIICGVEEDLEKSTGRKIKVLRSDNGGEYKSDPFLNLCRDEGIDRHFTVRETSNKMGSQKG